MPLKNNKASYKFETDLIFKRNLIFFLGILLSSNCQSVNYKNIEEIPFSQYSSLLENYRSRAEEGDPEALNNLGTMYLKGSGVAQDYIKAREYFKLATSKNLPVAMYHLGLIYHRGLGVKKNSIKAQNWFGKAAELGDREAQFFLGSILASNRNDSTSNNDAIIWFRKAAKAGLPAAQYNLAMLLFQQSKGTDFDQVSLYWLIKAAKNLHAESILALARIYASDESHHKALQSITPKLIMLAEQGDMRAQYRLGILYFLGRGVEPDLQESGFWLQQAALAGFSNAQIDLARIRLNTEHRQRTPEGPPWSKVAIDPGNEIYQYNPRNLQYLSTKQKAEGTKIEQNGRDVLGPRSESNDLDWP